MDDNRRPKLRLPRVSHHCSQYIDFSIDHSHLLASGDVGVTVLILLNRSTIGPLLAASVV